MSVVNRINFQRNKKLAIGLFVGLAVSVVLLLNIFQRLELISLDLRFRLRGRQGAAEEIVMIGVDDQSVRKIGRWPWSRDWHATMVTILNKLEARAIMFDVLFTDKQGEEFDSVFEEALKRYGNIYLPTAFVKDRRGRLIEALEPLERFQKFIKGTGHINGRPDPDGVIRRVPLFFESEGELTPQVMLSLFCREGGTALESLIIKPGQHIIIPSEPRDLYLPVDHDLNMLVNWIGPWNDSFEYYSFADILADYNRHIKGLKTEIDFTRFKDKIFIVGVTATGLYDIKPSPLEPAYPAPGVNATVLSNLLANRFLYEAPAWLNVFIILLCALAMSSITSRLHPWLSVIGMGALTALFSILCIYLFQEHSFIITMAHAMIAIVTSYIAVSVYSQIELMRERAELAEAAIRDPLTGLYNVANFKALLDQHLLHANMRGIKFVSLIMCDIDHFKKINDQFGHQVGNEVLQRIATILKTYVRAMDVVARYGGEEFIILVPGTNTDQAAEIAEQLRSIVEKQPFRNIRAGMKVTVSFGVATGQVHEDSQSLIHRADEALYAAKQNGRNQVRIAAR